MLNIAKTIAPIHMVGFNRCVNGAVCLRLLSSRLRDGLAV